MHCHAIIYTGRRSCMFPATSGHGGYCTFHWHRRTLGHRPGWPVGFTAPCCQPVIGSDTGENLDTGWDATMLSLLSQHGYSKVTTVATQS